LSQHAPNHASTCYAQDNLRLRSLSQPWSLITANNAPKVIEITDCNASYNATPQQQPHDQTRACLLFPWTFLAPSSTFDSLFRCRSLLAPSLHDINAFRYFTAPMTNFTLTGCPNLTSLDGIAMVHIHAFHNCFGLRHASHRIYYLLFRCFHWQVSSFGAFIVQVTAQRQTTATHVATVTRCLLKSTARCVVSFVMYRTHRRRNLLDRCRGLFKV
jgi:hypothetical protein